MKKITSILLGCLCALTAFAAPARKGWQNKTLADGTTLAVQQMGDEYYHFWATRDGKMVRELENGSFVLTQETIPSDTQIAARREASPLYVNRARKVGTIHLAPRVLVILVSYTDVAFRTEDTQAAMDSLLNVTGYDYNWATGSARDYFIAQSDSQYMPVFDVVGPITLSNNRAYYGTNSSGNTDKRAGEMIKEACRAVDNVIDFSRYDSDGDGVVDAVYVIYAGVGANDVGGEADAIWPHQHYVSGLTLDGKSISTYACSGAIDGLTLDRTGIGPICHEFSHALGMPDYYSTGPSAAYVVCEWSAMDYGMYNNNANTPPNYSLFDKQFMGWTSVTELEANTSANITLGTNYGEGFKMVGSDATYYIENRQLTGWDIALPGSGMLVWQVKYNQSSWNLNHVNYTNTAPLYSIISAAHGLMTNGSTVWSSNADPFPGSSHVRTWNTVSGFALTNIAETNGIITFSLNGGKTQCTYEILAEHCSVPEDGVLAVGNTLSLIIEPETGYRLNDADCWAVEMGSWNPLLQYGIDFTYDPNTHEFRIENVSNDVVIMVEAIPDTGTPVESVQHTETGVRKLLSNGQLIIIRDGKRYSAQGTIVQ